MVVSKQCHWLKPSKDSSQNEEETDNGVTRKWFKGGHAIKVKTLFFNRLRTSQINAYVWKENCDHFWCSTIASQYLFIDLWK